MDFERQIISKVLRMRSGMRRAMDARITTEFFVDDSSQRAWLWCVEYWREYGEAPTEEAFKADYPAYRLSKTSEPFDFVVEQLKERRRRTLLTKMIERVSSVIDTEEPVGSPTKQAIQILQEELSGIEIEVSSTRDDNVGKTVEVRLERYKQMEENKGKLLGLPTGYPGLDYASGGLQAEQLITVVGLSKAGKSIMLLNMAQEAYAAGAVPMFVSFEMSNREQELRFDGMASGINYRKIMGGALTKKDWNELTRSMHSMANYGDFILTSDTTRGMTISSVAAKAQQHYPDVIFIDGVYMMDDDDKRTQKGSSAALTNITRGMKQLAQRLRIPIVVTTQALAWKQGAKSKGLTSDAIGYTSSFVQDSDLVVVMFHEEDRPDVAKLRITENRMGPKGEFTFHWDFDKMDFSQIDDFGDIPGNGEIRAGW